MCQPPKGGIVECDSEPGSDSDSDEPDGNELDSLSCLSSMEALNTPATWYFDVKFLAIVMSCVLAPGPYSQIGEEATIGLLPDSAESRSQSSACVPGP